MDDFSDLFRLPNVAQKVLALPDWLQPFGNGNGQDDDDEWDEDIDDDEWDEDIDDDEWDEDIDDDLNEDCLHQHLKRLSEYYPLWLDDDYRFVIVQDVRLPPGYNHQDTDFLIELPPDYPFSPPGIGNHRIFTYSDLRFHGQVLKDLHPTTRPQYSVRDFSRWAWFCYEEIHWSPLTDCLITFMEMVRTNLSNPRI